MTALNRILASATGLILITACATSSSSYVPKLEDNHTGIIGKFKISRDGSEITELCSIELTDNSGDRKSYVRLDQSGWLFTNAPSGETRINMVMCRVGNIVKTNIYTMPWHLKFEAVSKQQIYIGDFSIDMKNASDNSALGGASAGMGNEVNSEIKIADNFKSAQIEFNNRFPTFSQLSLKNQIVTTQ